MYLNGQFAIPGYSLSCDDQVKGGGGILAHLHVSTAIPCKRLIKLNRPYKCIEAITLEITAGRWAMAINGIYQPPRALGIYG